MPTFNRAYVLWKAILSIQSQTFPYWELIVVDDRSEDDTEKLMREFRNDSRITYIKNDLAHSPAGARQKGLYAAQGEYIAYLDSDNTADKLWLEIMLEHFEAEPIAHFAYPSRNFRLLHLVNGEFRVYREETGYSIAPTIETLWTHDFEGDPNGLIHKATDNIKWDQELSLYEDYDYSLQLANLFPSGMLYVPITLINYTRLYGEVGICNDASYGQIVENLKKLDE